MLIYVLRNKYYFLQKYISFCDCARGIEGFFYNLKYIYKKSLAKAPVRLNVGKPMKGSPEYKFSRNVGRSRMFVKKDLQSYFRYRH